jgi:hypothetical protein
MVFFIGDLFGTIFYVSLFLVNAMAVLSEDRFLARGTSQCPFDE